MPSPPPPPPPPPPPGGTFSSTGASVSSKKASQVSGELHGGLPPSGGAGNFSAQVSTELQSKAISTSSKTRSPMASVQVSCESQGKPGGVGGSGSSPGSSSSGGSVGVPLTVSQ